MGRTRLCMFSILAFIGGVTTRGVADDVLDLPRIIDAMTGEPIGGGRVALIGSLNQFGPRTSRWEPVSSMLNQYRGPVAEIENDGRFRFDIDDPDEDAWMVVVTTKGNWTVVDHARDILVAGGDVPVPESVSLRGTVRRSPAAADPPRVSITLRPPMAAGPTSSRDRRRFRITGAVPVDPDGGFEVVGMTPGRYRVDRVKDLSFGINGMAHSQRFPLDGEDVFLRPGHLPAVTLGRVGGRRVCGSVVDDSGRSVGGVAVTIDGDAKEPGYVDAVVADGTGNFCLTDVPAGEFIVQVRVLGGGGRRTGRAKIKVPPATDHGPGSVTIDPIVIGTVGPMSPDPDDRRPAIPFLVDDDEPGGEIAGRVIDRSGKVDFDTTQVWVGQPGSTDATPTRIDADGGFRFRVRPGEYWIGLVEGPEGTAIARLGPGEGGPDDPIRVAVDEKKTRDLTIVPTRQIYGQLVQPDGRALRGQIHMIAINRVVSDPDGSFRDMVVPTVGRVRVTYFGGEGYKTRDYGPDELRTPVRLEVPSFSQPLVLEASGLDLERLDPGDSRPVGPIGVATVVRLWHPYDRSEVVRRRGSASGPSAIIAVDWDRTAAARVAAEMQTSGIDLYWAGPGGDRLPGRVRYTALPAEVSIE